MANFKKLFPIFDSNKDLVYLDSASTTFLPEKVTNKINEYYTNYPANIGRGLYPISLRATDEYESARKKVAQFINADPEEIIFTSGTTESVNLAGIMLLSAGILNNNSLVLLSPVDHHSTILPWRQVSNNIEYFGTTENFEIEINNLIPNIIAIASVSNVTGGKVDVKNVREAYPDSLLFIDASQEIGKSKINVKESQVDMLCFSAHKMYGPHGVGILYVKKDLLAKLQPVNFGGGTVLKVDKKIMEFNSGPSKFEAGTRNIEGVIGLGAAVDFINEIDISNIQANERELKSLLLNEMKNINGIKIIHSFSNESSGIISFYHEKIHAHDLAFDLSEKNICVRAGNHCAQILHNEIISAKATTRVSIGLYNNANDVNSFVGELKNIITKYEK